MHGCSHVVDSMGDSIHVQKFIREKNNIKINYCSGNQSYKNMKKKWKNIANLFLEI